jgi:hypothetical protein
MSSFAYVTVLYGNNIYLTGALVLGYSLFRTKTPYDRVILVTPDVSPEYRSFLAEVYTHVIPIEYMQVNASIFQDEATRFRDVFTKLECIGMTQYQKIILLDLDMIITQNMDQLFDLEAPAACLKKYDWPHGKKIPSSMICAGDKLTGSINAGLMLLKPDLAELNTIKSDIQKDNQLLKFKYPEQDYLSLRYCNKWTSISFQYNYQFGLTFRTKKYGYKMDQIYVIHYSSSYKPWNNLKPSYQAEPDEKKFINQHYKYYAIWKKSYAFIKDFFSKKGMTVPY